MLQQKDKTRIPMKGGNLISITSVNITSITNISTTLLKELYIYISTPHSVTLPKTIFS